MAKLPELDSTPVSTAGSAAVGMIAEARRSALDVFEKGFTMVGQELVKSQMGRAMADVSRGLNEIELDLDSHKTFTTQEVRDRLGTAYDSLPAGVRSQLTRRGLDLQTGQAVDANREDIPSWVVAGPIYQERSRKVLHDAAQGISSEGWAAEFQDKAAQEVLARQVRLGEKQLKDFADYSREADTSSALELANTGSYGQARAMVEGSRTMDLDYKKKVLDHVDKIEQVAPVFEALRRNDYGKMAEYVGKLNDPAEFTKLSPQERTAFSDRLQAEIKQFDVAAQRELEAKVKAVAEEGWNRIFEKERARMPVSYADIPPPGTIHAEAQKEMIAYVDKLNRGEKPETDWGVYAGLLQVARDPKKFAQVDLMAYRNRLADPEFKSLLDAQLGLHGRGNPDAYDTFQTTDEAINFRLRGYGIDESRAKYSSDVAQKVGMLKTVVQHELADEQRANGGKPLDVKTRDAVIDRVLGREIDPKAGFFDSTSLPALKAGVPASVASSFRSAVQALDPAGMARKEGRVKALRDQYQDFAFYSPQIERAWQVQRGTYAQPDDAVRVWYHLKSRWGELEARLRATGGWTEDKVVRQRRLVHMAVQEVVAGRP